MNNARNVRGMSSGRRRRRGFGILCIPRVLGRVLRFIVELCP